MKLTFLIPPCFDHKQPAERTAGCTRVVYQAPNIYELTVAAVLEQNPADKVCYRDFIYTRTSEKQFVDFIAGDGSDVYLMWTVNLSVQTDVHTVGLIRRLRPDVPVVMMGPGPTHFTRECLVDRNVYVVRGEPEESVRELMEYIRRGEAPAGVEGISYLDAGGKQVNNRPRPLIKDLDALPFPARHLIENQVFHNPKLKTGPYTTVVTSRNCPYRCIYCVPSSLTFAREMEFRAEHGRKPTIGFRSPESVEAEIAQLAAQGYRAIGFMDDNFIWNEERTAAICAIMKRHGMLWGCQARADAITEPIARMLGGSNCRYVDLGIESFDDEILEYIRKGETADDFRRAVALLKKYKVPVKLNVLIGSSPLETKESVLRTLREAKRLGADQVMFNIVSPFPGTEYYTICKENGWLVTDDYVPTDVQRESILNLPNLSSREMERLLFRNNLSFFLSPRFVLSQITRFRSFSEFKSALKALKIKLFG